MSLVSTTRNIKQNPYLTNYKDINPFGQSYPEQLTDVNGTLYFTADDGVNGRELWKSDGTAAGTVLVKDITIGGDNSNLILFPVGNLLYFMQLKRTNVNGSVIPELWRTDGTTSNTVLVHNHNLVYSANFILWQTQAIGSTFYYTLHDEFYRVDQNGVKQIDVPVSNARFPFGYSFSVVDNEIYAITYTDSNVLQIIKAGATTTTAQVVGRISGIRLTPPLIFNNRTLYFAGDNGTSGYELYRTSVCSHTAKINTPNSTSFCPGSSVNIVAEGSGTTGPFTYNWKQGTANLGTNATLAANRAGTHTVEVTDSQGCTVSTSVDITQTANLPVVLSGTPNFCSGQSTPLSASVSGGVGPLTYQWRITGTPVPGIATSTLSATVAGTYSVSAIDSRGCSGLSANVVVTQKPTPTATISPAGITNILSGTAVVFSTPAATGQTYQWFRDGVAIPGATNNTYSANQQGNYTVTVVRDGCLATSANPVSVALILAAEPVSDGITLTVSPNPTDGQIRAVLTLETPAPATFRLTDGTGRSLQSWSFDRPALRHEQRLDISNAPSGLYFLQAEAGEKKVVSKIVKQ